ncbi:hypothetical protein BGX21_004595 [Mortierella sp. AD011]|nr:hypothetical protein BGX21_004595 [Mortierella sp. AD011]
MSSSTETPELNRRPSQNVKMKRKVTFKLESDTPEEQQHQRLQLQRYQQQQQQQQQQPTRGSDDSPGLSADTDTEDNHGKKLMSIDALKAWRRFNKNAKKTDEDRSNLPAGQFLESILKFTQRVVIPFDIEFGIRNQEGKIHVAGAERFIEPVLKYLLKSEQATSQPGQATMLNSVLTTSIPDAQADSLGEMEQLKLKYLSLTKKHKIAAMRVTRQQTQMDDLRDRIEELQDRVEELEAERHRFLSKSRRQHEETSIVECKKLSSPQQDDHMDTEEDIILEKGVVTPLISVDPHWSASANDIRSYDDKLLSENNQPPNTQPNVGASHPVVGHHYSVGSREQALEPSWRDAPQREALPSQSLHFQSYCQRQEHDSSSSAPLLSFATSLPTPEVSTISPETQSTGCLSYFPDIPSDSSMSPELPDPSTAKITTVRGAPTTKNQSRKAKARRLLLEQEREKAREANMVAYEHEHGERIPSPRQSENMHSFSPSPCVQDTGAVLVKSIESAVVSSRGYSYEPILACQVAQQALLEADTSRFVMTTSLRNLYDGSLSERTESLFHASPKDPRLRHLQASETVPAKPIEMSVDNSSATNSRDS